MARPSWANDCGPGTIADYWISHGYSREEALEIQWQQIRSAMEQEEIHEAMDRGVI